MNRRDFAILMMASLSEAGCSWFDSAKKTPLPGERISVLGLDRRLTPDPALANVAVTLPRPLVNADWPEPGGYPNHAMYHLGLPQTIERAWETSIGDGTSRYHKVMSQPVIARNTVFAMDGGVQVSALSASNGSRLWQVDLKPEEMRGNGFGGGPCVLEGSALRRDGLRRGSGARPGRRQGDLAEDRSTRRSSAPTVVGRAGLCRDRRQRARRVSPPRTGGGCGPITASPRPQACSAAPARRSKARSSSSPTIRASYSRCASKTGGRYGPTTWPRRAASTRCPDLPISAGGR